MYYLGVVSPLDHQYIFYDTETCLRSNFGKHTSDLFCDFPAASNNDIKLFKTAYQQDPFFWPTNKIPNSS